MKLVKSLLLGSAAGLVAVAGASAADLGVKKPTAVEYVKTCPQYGAGFFVVPGTTSCLRVLGRVRVQYMFNNSLIRGVSGTNGDLNTFRARGYLQADHRTATEYGLVRTFIRLWINRDNAGTAAVPHAPNVELAFIQFGGATFGRSTSIFEHGYGFALYGSNSNGGFSDLFAVNQAAYTFSFGGGFSASVALESGNERRGTISGTTYAGQAAPDVLASLDYSASWGSVKLAGAMHQVRETGVAGVIASTKWGYAVTGAAKFNLPFGAAGSNLWVNGTYAVGANTYAGYAGSATIGNRTYAFNDAVLSGGALQLTRTMAIAGGIQAFFTPTVYAGVSAYYATHDQFAASNTVTTTTLLGTVGWVPVAGMAFIGEVAYRTVQFGAGYTPTVPAGATGTTVKRNDITGVIRVQRDF